MKSYSQFILIFLSLSSCSHHRPSPEESATVLSQNTPNLKPVYFPCEKDSGRAGVWVSAEQPRYTGARAFVSLQDGKKQYLLMTFQYRKLNGKKTLVAEGPAGGFDTVLKEDKNLFEIREKLLFEASESGNTADHRKINAQALEISRKSTTDEHIFTGGDQNSYRTAIREGFEETGMKAFILDDQTLLQSGVTRTIRLMRLDETNNLIIPMYHITFSCTDCLTHSDLLKPRETKTEEVEYTKWLPLDAFIKDDLVGYKVKSAESDFIPVKPNNHWHEALDEILGHTPSPLDRLSHTL